MTEIKKPTIKTAETKIHKTYGVAIPKAVQTPLDYLSSIGEYVTDSSINQQIQVSRTLYTNEGICGLAVDTLLNFALTDLRAEKTGDKDLDLILHFFNERMNEDLDGQLQGVKPFSRRFLLDFLLSGNPFSYESWTEMDGKFIDSALKIPMVKLPLLITFLDPIHVSIERYPFSFHLENLYYQIDDNLAKVLSQDGRKYKNIADLKKNFSEKTLRSIKSGNKNIGAVIPLDRNLTIHIKRNAMDYTTWGVPYLVRAFPGVALLRKFRRLDEVTTDGLINLVTVFKIGTAEKPATANRLQAFANLLKNPKSNTTLVWGHDVEVDQVGPEGKVLAISNKYDEINNEIIKALGFPLSFVDLDAGSRNSIIYFENMLEDLRTVAGAYIEKIYRKIAVQNNKNYAPKVRWSKLRLSDDISIKNQVLSAYDRGILSRHTALKEAGWAYDDEIELKREEQSDNNLFLPPKLPFSGNSGDSGGRPVKNSPKSTTNTSTKKAQGILLEGMELSLGAVIDLFDIYYNDVILSSKSTRIEKLKKAWASTQVVMQSIVNEHFKINDYAELDILEIREDINRVFATVGSLFDVPDSKEINKDLLEKFHVETDNLIKIMNKPIGGSNA